MNVLVTGCNGYVGGHLVERLLAEGHRVVGVDHRPETWQAFGTLGAYRFVRLELAERAAVAPLAAALEGVEAVFHLASRQPFSQELARFIYGNVYRTATLLEALRLAGLRRLIQSSTFAVYGEAKRTPIKETDPTHPQHPYEVTKHQAEQLARLYSDQEAIVTTVLRYPSLYGGRNRVGSLHYFMDAACKGTPINLFAEGKPVKEFVHVGDVVQANIACLSYEQEQPFEVFNIGSGEPVAMRDLVHLIFEVTGRVTAVTYARSDHWRATDLYLDIEKARQKLAYRPRSLKAGLQAYLQTLQAEDVETP